MATQVQRRKGTTVQHSTFTGASAELTVDNTKNTVVVHDGATAGGFPLAKESGSALSPSSVTLSGGTANGVAYLNGSKVVTTGSALTFDGTTFGVQVSGRAVNFGTTSAANFYTAYRYNSSDIGYIGNGPSVITAGTSATDFAIGTATTNPLLFAINSTEGMRLTSTGLGIGTSSPSAKLHVAGSSAGVEALFSYSSGTPTIAIGNSATTYNTQIGYNVSSEYGYIQAVAAAGVYDDIAINPNGGNVGIGTSSPAYKLDVSGVIRGTSDALLNGITVGRGAGAVSTNTAVGASALYVNTTGNENAAFGTQAMYSNTTGYGNGAHGTYALYTNTTGYYNSAYGRGALFSNTSGFQNTAVGSNSMLNNTTGTNNVAVGFYALQANTTASNNTAVGYQAGYTNSTGASNTFIGQTAGYSATGSQNTFSGMASGYLTTGSGNTFVGYTAGYNVSTGAKNTIIGQYNGNQGGLDIRTSSNYVVLSDGDGNPRAYWNGADATFGGTLSTSGNIFSGTSGSTQRNITLATTGGSVIIISHSTTDANGDLYAAFKYNGTQIGSISQSGTTAVLFNVTSDQRLKENIVDAPEFGSIIDAIQVRSYDWKAGHTHQRAGFIAQELVTVAPEAVHQPADPEEMMAVDYSKLVPMLVKEIQSLRKRLADAGIA